MDTKKSKLRLSMIYGSMALVLLLVIAGTYYSVRIWTYSQACYTVEQVQSDSRCLYIIDNKVFEKGTRDQPHKGHPCGTDVSSIVPSFHRNSPAQYLDPNYKGNICANQPADSPTPSPSPVPSNTPVPTDTPAPTATIPQPTNRPASNALVPTNASTPTSTPVITIITATLTITATTLSPTKKLTPTSIPLKTSSDEATLVSSTPMPTISMLPVTGKIRWLLILVPITLVLAGLSL